MHFAEAVQYLLGLGHETISIKLGLRNTELLLQALDRPERAYPSVQIAGTNGKGSTAAMLDSICRAAGVKSGLYTSPHLVSITERIQISGTPISPEAFAAGVTLVRETSERLVNENQLATLPTFFEQLTVTALLAFQNAGIELAILETGLGGRLDSTTAARAGIVAITPIAIDHEEYLGHSLASIAGEKAAIIRPGVLAVIANQDAGAESVILRRCEETGVDPILEHGRQTVKETTRDGRIRVTFETESSRYEDVWLGLRGRHQIANAALAIRLAELLSQQSIGIPHAAIVEGIETASHLGRVEILRQEPTVLIDGAHNAAGAQSLRDYLNEFATRPLTLVFGAMRDKQLEQMGEILFSIPDVLILTTIENPRTASIGTLRAIAERVARGEVLASGSSQEALLLALERTPAQGIIAVAGSLYLVGEVRPLILGLP